MGEVDDIVTDEDELNDSSQKPMIMATNFAIGAKNSNSTGTGNSEPNWRTNYSGSSSLSSFSYSPRSNNSSVSSHGKKLQNNSNNSSSRQNHKESAQINGSLRSNDSLADKNSVDSLQ